MTISGGSLSDALKEIAAVCRSDYDCVDGLGSDSGGEGRLFWETYRPQVFLTEADDYQAVHELDPQERTGVLARLAHPAVQDLEQRFVSRLAELEGKFGVAAAEASGMLNEVASDWSSSRKGLFAAYMSAARALGLKRVQRGYSEDALDCLKWARYAGELAGVPNRDINGVRGDDPWFWAWWRALHGIVCLELFSAHQRTYGPEELLRLLSTSLECLNDSVWFFLKRGKYLDFAGLARHVTRGHFQVPHDLLECDDEDFEREFDYELTFNFEHFGNSVAAQFAPQQVVDVVERALGLRGANWKQLATECEKLTRDWDGLWDVKAEVVDEQGHHWEVGTYALYAVRRAEDFMRPDEFRDFRFQQEDEAAEERLKRYFFFPPELWNLIPEKARRALVDADRAWFSSRRGRAESALEDLKVAVEAVCFEVIWEPLRLGSNDSLMHEFREWDQRLTGDRHSPSLVDYAHFCREPFLVQVARRWGCDPTSLLSMSRDWPRLLNRLNRARNSSEHDPVLRGDPTEVSVLLNAFLGVGQGGLLPALIGLKARSFEASRTPSQVPRDASLAPKPMRARGSRARSYPTGQPRRESAGD